MSCVINFWVYIYRIYDVLFSRQFYCSWIMDVNKHPAWNILKTTVLEIAIITLPLRYVGWLVS